MKNYLSLLVSWGFTLSDSGRGRFYSLTWDSPDSFGDHRGLIKLSGKEIRDVFEQSPVDLHSFLTIYEDLYYKGIR